VLEVKDKEGMYCSLPHFPTSTGADLVIVVSSKFHGGRSQQVRFRFMSLLLSFFH
jgi:hypothetical protein